MKICLIGAGRIGAVHAIAIASDEMLISTLLSIFIKSLLRSLQINTMPSLFQWMRHLKTMK